jgi:DNA-binding transcriptional LysR family regulator
LAAHGGDLHLRQYQTQQLDGARSAGATVANKASRLVVPLGKQKIDRLARFQKAVPHVKVLLHDLSSDELIAGLRNATLELALMMQPIDEQTAGIEFEILRTYSFCVALTAAPPPVGIARATKGDVAPAGEKFCEILRQTSN